MVSDTLSQSISVRAPVACPYPEGACIPCFQSTRSRQPKSKSSWSGYICHLRAFVLIINYIIACSSMKDLPSHGMMFFFEKEQNRSPEQESRPRLLRHLPRYRTSYLAMSFPAFSNTFPVQLAPKWKAPTIYRISALSRIFYSTIFFKNNNIFFFSSIFL